MNEKHESWRDERLFYVFVCPGAVDTQPTCWIVPSGVVADHIRDTHKAWLADGREKNLKRNDSGKRAFHRWSTRPPLPQYGQGWLDAFKEAWQLLN